MRGKKVDSQFLTEFIQVCASVGYATPEQMVERAQKEIEKISDQIKRVEELKLRRSKLLDVIAIFHKPVKNNREEVRILSFFQIQNPHICKFICNLVKTHPRNREQLEHLRYSSHDINFCIKQLLEHRVIAKVGDSLLRGEMFDEYAKFVLQEE